VFAHATERPDRKISDWRESSQGYTPVNVLSPTYLARLIDSPHRSRDAAGSAAADQPGTRNFVPATAGLNFSGHLR
jgi:hypothetical protein